MRKKELKKGKKNEKKSEEKKKKMIRKRKKKNIDGIKYKLFNHEGKTEEEIPN